MGTINHVYTQTVADGTATSVVRPSDWNSAHAFTMQDAVSMLGTNTLGVSALISTGTLYLAGGNNISLSQNGNSISILDNDYLSYYEHPVGPFVGTTTMQAQGSTAYVFPFNVRENLSVSFVRFIASWNVVSTSFATTGTASTTFSQANTFFWVMYGQGAGANSMSLQSVASSSAGWTWQVSHTATGNGSVWSISQNITYPVSGVTSSTQFTASASSSIVSVATTQLTNFTNIRYLDIPFATGILPDNYWGAIIRSSATGGGKGIDMAVSIYAMSQVNTAIGNLGAATASSNQFQPGLGSFTTTAFGTTASIALANISSSANQPRPYIQMLRYV